MRRADRLLAIVQRLQGGRLVTARALADALAVSTRTIYRDVADLQASGMPVDGAAGVGYLLRAGYHLPPLMFRPAEIEALIVGARMVRASAGSVLAKAADDALATIAAVAPPERIHAAGRVPVFASPLRLKEVEASNLDFFARAIERRLKVRLTYRDADGTASARLVWPLTQHFWARAWSLGAWCELHDDFRTFDIDHAEEVSVTEDSYPHMAGRTLRDYLDRMRACEQPAEPVAPTRVAECTTAG